jgi:hypothetical protein
MLNVIMLSLANKPFMLSVFMLNVVMLSVVMLNVMVPYYGIKHDLPQKSFIFQTLCLIF